MLIKILIAILGLFFILAFESFFTSLFSFSVFIVVTLLLVDKLDWKKWTIFTVIAALLIDVLMHRVIGVTLLVTSISTLLLYAIFLVMPKKKIILSYLPYFLSLFVFYILLIWVSPFVQDRVWGVVTWQEVLFSVIKSLLSILVVFVANKVIDNFRSDRDLLL